MDYFGIINKSIEYIEENIKEKLTLEEISKKIFLSPFHFHRVFTAFTGFSVMEYIRKRKLHLAIEEIKNKEKTILEIAVDYGYSTNESFSRAIQKECGKNPSEIRKNGLKIEVFQRFKLWGKRYAKNHGDKKIFFELIQSEEMLICGIMRKLTLNDGKNYIEIPKIKKVLMEGKEFIKNLKYPELNRQIGVALTGPMDLRNPFNNNFFYFRGFELMGYEEAFNDFEIKKIAAMYCGKFYAGKTVKEHSDTLDYVYGIWLTENNFELEEKGFDFMEEIIEYENGDRDFYFYIPIKEQKKSSIE